MLNCDGSKILTEEPHLSQLVAGIPVVVLTAKSNSMKGFYACRYKDCSYIVVPKQWRDLQEETLRFVMYHEQGHLVHKDWVTTIRMVEKGISQRNMEKLLWWHEFCADEFAVEKIGRKVALRSLSGLISWPQPNSFMHRIAIVVEMRLRQIALLSRSRRWKRFVLRATFWSSGRL